MVKSNKNDHDCIPWELPEWAPNQLRERFIWAKMNVFRYCLQERALEGTFACQQLETWIESFIALRCSPNTRQLLKSLDKTIKPRPVLARKGADRIPPPEVIFDLGILIYAKYIVDLGKIDGLLYHLGGEGAKMFWEITFGEKI